MAKIFRPRLILFLILAVAAFLRFWRLDQVPVSLFGDELDVGYHAYSILRTGRDYSGNFLPIHFQSLAEWRTPLYLYSAVPTVAIFGISPWGVRLPAAIFGILGVAFFYFLVKLITGNWKLATLAAALLAISPWHIQYSRGGFEVTQMLFFFMAGIYFFLRGLKNGKWLVLSAIFLALTPWVYSTAKLFLPLTILSLVFIWRQDFSKISRRHLLTAILAFTIVVAPITWSTISGGGGERFTYLSVFGDPTRSGEIGAARLQDAKMMTGKPLDLFFHNKFTWWGEKLLTNYLESFSTQFLFIAGDPNPRHSLQDMGQFYKIEALFLLLGIVFLLTRPLDKKLKLFLIFWILAAPIPSALTRDGGMHATRLFFLLPPLILLVAMGIYGAWEKLRKQPRMIFVTATTGLYLLSAIFYLHNYWVHYPWDSQRWWHAGFEDAIKTAVGEAPKYEKVIISMAGEPAWIFFLGWSEFPPAKLQASYLPGTAQLPKENVPGFGEVSKIDKYYFGSPSPEVSVYQLAAILPDNSLYVATAKEVNVNLIAEPERKPGDLKLVKAVAYPSGEPAFYLFSRGSF